MSDAFGLAAGIALPWLAGFAVVRALLGRFGAGDRWLELGYGHFVGVLLVTLVLRACSLAGLGLEFVAPAVTLVAIAAAALAADRRWRRPRALQSVATTGEPVGARWLVAVILALITVRVGLLASEVLLRPLYPWDAWSQWATKAKVWSALRELVPFIGYDDWLSRARPGYTDTAPHYPATIPLLQTWMTLALGRWDDALMNIGWPAAYVALGAGVFGQLRRLGLNTVWAAVGAYLTLSLPLLEVHVALAGYADLHLAAAYALALLALAKWEANHDSASLALLVASACLLPLLKVPGIAWAGTLALGGAIVAFGTTPLRIAALGALVVAATVGAAVLLGLARVTAEPAATPYGIVESLGRHLFAFGNWNLLWYLFPLSIAVAWRQALALKATTITLACGIAFLAWTFLFTQAGDWVVDYTTINRALLHIAPAVAAFTLLLVWRWASERVAPDLLADEARTASAATGDPGSSPSALPP